MFSMIWYVKFNRLPCPADKTYDMEIFADRFRFQLTIFDLFVLVGISRLWCSYYIWNSYCEIHRKIPPNFQLLGMIWHGWMKSSAVSKRWDIRWRSFRWSIPLSIDCVWNSCIGMAISTPSSSYCVFNSSYQNHCRTLPNFPLSSMIWCGWIQSSAAPKRQDVRWWSFLWSFPISIDYVWNAHIDRVISAPSWSNCIWNIYIKNHCC